MELIFFLRSPRFFVMIQNRTDSRTNNPEKPDSRRPGKIDGAQEREESCNGAKSIYVQPIL